MLRKLAPALIAAALSTSALAQSTENSFVTPNGAMADGKVMMCINAAGKAVPVDQTGACPGLANPGAYSSSQTPITGNAVGSTSAVTGTLAAASGKTTYICGFNVSAIGGTAPIGPVTVAGLVGSSQVYQASSAAAGVLLSQTFNPCIPASAVNTPITITTTADGSATAVDVNSWGFRQ